MNRGSSKKASDGPTAKEGGQSHEDGVLKSKKRVAKDLQAVYLALEAICKVRAQRQKLSERQDKGSSVAQKQNKVLEANYREVHSYVGKVKNELMMVSHGDRYVSDLRTILGDISEISNKKHDNDRHTCAALTLNGLKKLKERLEAFSSHTESGGEEEGSNNNGGIEDSLDVMSHQLHSGGNNSRPSSSLSSKSSASSRQSTARSTASAISRGGGSNPKGPQLLDALEDLTELKALLERFYSSISRVLECKQGLKKVKSEDYMAKFERTLATEMAALEQLIPKMELISQKFQPNSSHAQLVSVILSAANSDDISSPDVLSALKTDISAHIRRLAGEIRKESTNRYGRVPGSASSSASSASTPSTGGATAPRAALSLSSKAEKIAKAPIRSLKSAGEQIMGKPSAVLVSSSPSNSPRDAVENEDISPPASVSDREPAKDLGEEEFTPESNLDLTICGNTR